MTMVKIGVLSDTHLPDSGEAMAFLAALAQHCFADVDMIIHAGDVVAPEILAAFGDIPVHAVRGNMDPAVSDIPVRKIVGVKGFRIGMIHGWGTAKGLEKRLLAEFASDRIDCLVFGHSHSPICEVKDGVLLFNPGSATDRRSAPSHTVGILEIDSEIRGRIVSLD
ncbi:MAG: metallophosphatase family protein [Desulfuromonadales bacterium]|nr:metallophosphatase family protein [Desulfuromonadales bacterium]